MEIDEIIFFAAICGIGLGVFIFASKKFAAQQAGSKEAVRSRINALEEQQQQDLGASELKGTMLAIYEAIGNYLPVPTPEKLKLLDQAGIRGSGAYLTQVVEQIVGGVLGFIVGFVLIGLLLRQNALEGFLCGVILGGGAYFLSWEGVKGKIKQRSLLLDKAVPNIIDLFANACAAGVTFDMAADMIIGQMGDEANIKPIKEDLLAWQADVRLGIPRNECWRKLAGRNKSKNIKYFSSLMDQSELSGGSASGALFKMAGFFRERRKQQIEAEIAALGGKMNALTIIFIALPMLAMLVIPIMRMVGEQFKEAFGG